MDKRTLTNEVADIKDYEYHIKALKKLKKKRIINMLILGFGYDPFRIKAPPPRSSIKRTTLFPLNLFLIILDPTFYWKVHLIRNFS